MSDEWGKWLRPGSFIAAALCLLLAGHKFFVSGPTTNQVETSQETPYQYQLKKNNKVIKSYRNPASLKKAGVPAESRSFEVKNQNKDGDSYSNNDYSSENRSTSTSPSIISSSPSFRSGNNRRGHSDSRPSFNSENNSSQSSTSSTSSGSGTAVMGGGSLLPPSTPTTDTGSKNNSGDDQKEAPPIPRLFGKVVPLAGKITQNSNNPFISSAYAVGTCSDPRILLFDLIDMSVLLDNPISEDIILGEAAFEFDPIELKLNIKTPTRYLLHTKGCTENYQRIVTSFYSPQDLDFITSVIAQIINSEKSEAVVNVRSDNLDKLYEEIIKNTADPQNYDSILESISSNTDVGSHFQQAFQGNTTENIINSAPVINDVTITSPLKEKVAQSFTAMAEHWNNEYQIAYEWLLDGVTVSTSFNWIFTPVANSPTDHKITLITGKKATIGDTVDRSFAYHETSWDIEVEDTHPSLAPVVSFDSSVLNPTKTKNIKLLLETGIACETFSSFAITENNQTLDTATFSHICEAPTPQVLNYNVQAVTDGTRILKFWSKDVEGRISVTPLELSLTVDTTFPQITFNPLPASFASDEDHLIEWTLSEAHSSSTQNFTVELFDGTSWISLGNVPLLNGPHTGSPFSGNFHLPNQQILGAKIRITYADLLGQETIQETVPFNIYRPELGSSPVSINLGSTLNLSTSALTAFSITNTGLVPSKLCNSPVITGVNASEFTIISDGCALTNIPAGGSCPLAIQGTPTAKGIRSGILTITCGNDTYSTALTLESLNNAPVTADQNLTTLEDNSLSIVLGPINDTDGDSLTYTVPASSSNGTINNCLIAGSFYRCDYTPNLDFNGTDSFTFYSNDSIVDSNISTVTITVIAVNDEPVLSGVLSLSTPEDTPLLFDLVAGSDVDLDTLHYEITTPPTNGTLVCPLDTSTSCTYTPDLNYFGSDSFTYRVKDGSLNSLNSITASITVTPVNDAPTLATDQSFYTRDNEDFNFTINSGSDVDHLTSELSYKLVTDPAAGTLSGCLNTSSYSTDLTCTYKSPVHHHGPITITYLVYDGQLDSVSVATVTIDVEDKTPTTPQLTPANFTPTVSTTLSSLTLTSPNCNDISFVMIQEGATSPTPADSGWQSCTTAVGGLTFDPSITSQQGFRTLRIYGRDHNDNISSAQLVNFIYDTMAPQITFEAIPTLPNGISYPIKWRLTEASVNAGSTFKIEYSLNNGTSWTVASNMPVGQNGPHASTLFTYNWPVASGTYPNSLFRITLVDNNGMSGTATSNNFRILVDVTAPNLLSGGMKINGSTTPPPTPQKYVDVSLSALDDDTNITHFCFKNSSAQPAANHSCWRAVDAPQPGLAPSTTLNLANFPYLLSFVPGTFNVYAWIKDLSGNISTNTATVGTDVVSITYFGDYSPVISNFFVSNTLTPPNPIVAEQMEFLENDSVYIKWTATDDKGLLPTIRLSYTTDDINYYDIATNLANGLNNCSSLNEGGTSLDDNSTGCYNWVTPANLDNTYFRIQLIVEDNANQATSILSLPLNSTRFKILAGNIDPGVGSHAKSAIITTPGVPALYSLAVASDGKVFIRDAQFGLMYINPQTGIYEQLLTVTGASTGDNGPVRSASATKIHKITMDYQDRLIIWDYDRIRRVDTKTEPMMIETIIGAYNNGAAGTETTDIVTNPADLKVHPEPAASVLLQPLPNGDIYFQAGPWGTVNAGNTLRVYRGSLPAPTVTSIYVSGNGPLDYKGELLSLTEDTVTSYLIQFNSQTSAIEKMVTQLLEYPSGCSYYAAVNVDINSYVATPPHLPVHVSTCGDAYVRTGLDGKIYNIGYHVAYTVKVSRYNSVTNAHDMIIGSGQGYCADNTSATACRTYLSDVFVTPQGKVFFIDNGLVRVIDDSGNVQTLYGQTKTYGDNGLAQDARFNNLTYIDHGVGDNVIIYDSAEKIIREIRPNEVSNQIVLLAGNGQSAAVDFNLPANSQTLNGANWQQPGTFVTNPVDGTIYFACLWYQICKLNRATGKWEYHSGDPSTALSSWTNNGAFDATRMNYGAYAPTSLAYYNGKMITGHYSYNSTFRTSQYSTLRELNVTTKISTFLAGKTEVDGQGVCPDGAGNQCNLGSARSQGRALTYHTPSGSWLYEQLNNEIKLVKVSGSVGSISLFDVITDGVQSMVWNGDTLYYCNNNGELKKRNYTTSIETALPFPGSGIKCYGAKLLWKNASGNKPNRLVFPFTQNGLSGVAEYLSP